VINHVKVVFCARKRQLKKFGGAGGDFADDRLKGLIVHTDAGASCLRQIQLGAQQQTGGGATRASGGNNVVDAHTLFRSLGSQFFYGTGVPQRTQRGGAAHGNVAAAAAILMYEAAGKSGRI